MAEEKFDMEKWRGRTLTRAEFQALSPIDKAAFLESGGGGRIMEKNTRTLTRKEFDRLSVQEQATFIRTGGKLVE